MEKKGHSRKGFFGETIHYDANGNRIGESRRNFTGGYDHFDSNGHKVGSSHENFWGGTNHYDANMEKSGSSYRGFCGQTNHYNARGDKLGESTRNFVGGRNHYGTSNNEQHGRTPTPTNADESEPYAKKTNMERQYNYSTKRSSNGFDELLATVAVACLILFVLGALLRWDDVLLYFVIFIVSLTWFIIRNK